jgi:2,3-bisphosphoglycerate-dependent phosphoglycerate mutase
MGFKELPKTLRLVLLRHGQSTWNLENRFTGWTDVPLTEEGTREAINAGKLLKEANFSFDMVYTSMLRRAINTYNLVAEELSCHHLPVKKSWRLNERHYGALQGLNKAETAQLHGEEKVKLWRRSFAVAPPALETEDIRSPYNDPKYELVPRKILPLTESLKTASERALPYFYDQILGDMLKGERVLVVAHGNSLRAIVKELDNISEEKILGINIPTGLPLIYEFDQKLNVQKSYYLGNQDEIKKAQEEVANQAKKK